MKFDVVTDAVGFCEGPVQCRDGSIVITSLSDGCLYKVVDGQVSTFAMLGGGPNGAVEGEHGDLFVAQSGGVFLTKPDVPPAKGDVVLVRPDGSFEALGSGPRSPNDLAFGPDGMLYVTDPTRGTARDDGRLWRFDIESGECEQLTTMPWYCNGIAFSTETDCFYVADTLSGRILRFRLDDPRTEKAELVVQMTRCVPDGFAFDATGNFVIATVGRSESETGCLQVFSPEGKLLDIVETGSGQYCTNVAIDAERNIVVTDSSKGRLLKGIWPHPGLPLHPFRGA
ncbi:SMP-30/gluconolactonase/LRE family protein [Variovorax ureilyticus]|uniref:SMP-30/gluconolactonase/LRE family protein n=1 Tax=Variovorax ureilyticus TaxID=1836198 RepID=A0ABU8VLT7_9BURK